MRKTRVADAKTEASVSRASGPNYRLILGLSAVGAVVSLFLIPLLTERPGGASQVASRAGGQSVVEKSPLRSAAPRVVPAVPSQPQSSAPQEQAAPAPADPPMANSLGADGLPPGVTMSGPGFDVPAMPAPSQDPSAQMPFPGGLDAQEAVSVPSPPLPERTPEPPPAASAEPRQEMASLPPQDSAPVDLPGRSDIRGWARSTAREFVGGVDADGMPLYRFDIWLDAPANVRSQIRSVSYEYRAPSAQPPAQSSTDAGDGFRVKFGAAACAEKATITVQMQDGQQRSVDVDGCRILN